MISIATGIVVVLLVEIVLLIRHLIRRRNEINYIRDYFRNWESEIENVPDAEDGTFTREQARFALHKDRLQVAQLLISTRSPHLSASQSFEIIKAISDQSHLVDFIASAANVPAPSSNLYDRFFDVVRGIKWLKF